MATKSISLSLFSRYRAVNMGVAMIIIVLFHVALPRSSAWFGLRRMGNIGVDIFLFLSGIGMWYSWTRQTAQSAGTSFSRQWARFYRRRLQRVYPIWFLLACLYYIPRYSHGLQLWAGGHGLLDLLGDILINWDFWLHDELTFWYVPAIMLLYIFAPPYIRLISRHSEYRWLPLVMILWTFSVQWVTPIHQAVGHIEIFWSRVPIFFIGISLGKAVQEERSMPSSSLWLLLLLFLAAMVPAIYMEQHLHGRFPLFLERLMYIPAVVSGLLLLGMIWERSPRWLLRALAWVGGLSLEIYLLHSQFVLWRVESLHLGYWPTFLITLAVSLPMAWLLHEVYASAQRAVSSSKTDIKRKEQ